MKYTKEILEPIVRQSFSVAEVVRKLGLKCPNGGSHNHISSRIKLFGLDTSHFLGQMRAIGLNNTHRFDKKLPSVEVLVNNRLGRKEGTDTLRRAMIESGIKHVCGSCGLGPVWKDKRLVLQISHKDGDSLNNEKDNLHFECPNCHSQTEDYAGRSAGKKGSPLYSDFVVPKIRRTTGWGKIVAPGGMNWCSSCKDFKFVGDFNKNRNTRTGLQTHCKDCKKRER